MHNVSRTQQFAALALGIAAVLAAGSASASGFQLREQSVKNLGRSGAGSLYGVRNAAVVSLNPAAMSSMDKRTFQLDATVIDLNATFSGGGNVLAGTPLARPITGGNGGDPGDKTVVPNISAVFPLSGNLDAVTVGVAIGAPFGLKTEYEKGWVGRYRALTSDLKTVDLTTSIAFQMSDGVSVGAALVYERAEATLSKAIDFGTIACATAPGGAANCSPLAPFPIKPQSADGEFSVNGSHSGFGYILGAQIQPNEKISIGASYRSEIKHDLHGTLDFTAPAFITGNPLVAPRFADGPGGARLITPSVTTLSITYGFNDDFRIMGDFQQTDWSSLNNVTITRDAGCIGSCVVGTEDFNWKDTNFFALGAEFDISDAFTLRAGVAKDGSPTNNETRTPRLPDNDRKLYSIGATWNISDSLSIDAAYQHIAIDSPAIHLPATFTTGGTDFSTLQGSFSGSANLFGISGQYRF